MSRYERELSRRHGRGVPKKENDSKLFSRRQILLGGGLVATGVLAATGLFSTCNHNEQKSNANNVTPDLPMGSSAEDIQKYYPELGEARIRAQGEFQTGGIKVSWYNFSDYSFDANAAQNLYDFMHQTANSGIVGGIGDDEVRAKYEVKPTPKKDVKLIITDPSQPLNKRAKGQNASFTINDYPSDYVTIIRVKTPQTMSEQNKRYYTDALSATNKTLATEACQAVVNTESIDPVASRQAKEAFCNSIGEATYMRQNGIPFSTYKDRIEDAPLIEHPSFGEVTLIVVPDTFYSQIPTVKPLN